MLPESKQLAWGLNMNDRHLLQCFLCCVGIVIALMLLLRWWEGVCFDL